MRVIRPTSLTSEARRKALLPWTAACVAGLGMGVLAALVRGPVAAPLAVVAALVLGVGLARLIPALRLGPDRRAARELETLLAPAFDDSYTLLLLPRLPIAGRALTGLLVGPPGVRVLSVRRWVGRYRVRVRTWEFYAGRRGWITCRTNPGFEVASLADGVTRWAADEGLGQLPIEPAVAFPRSFSRVVLEEPAEEVVTVDNAPWWANSIGRVQRCDPAQAARFVNAVIGAGEELARSRPSVAPSRARRV